MSVRILGGDNRTTLATLPERSVHMAVTSPPYWALRSYLPAGHPMKSSEIGQEPTPELFVAALLDVFRAVRRVLRDDGTLWVNLGETYGGNRGNKAPAPNTKWAFNEADTPGSVKESTERLNRVGIPERFALAMQADGWVWRDCIIWHKPAPMPTSVNGWRWERCKVKVAAGGRGGNGNTRMMESGNRIAGGYSCDNAPNAVWSDCPGCPKCEAHNGWVLRRGSWRTTPAHEVILMFAKTGSYFCDAEAVKVPAKSATIERNQYSRVIDDPDEQYAVRHDHEFSGATANPRSVWTIGPQALKHKHYAAFPEELPRRCIEAGTSSKGCCQTCGAPWARMVERSNAIIRRSDYAEASGSRTAPSGTQEQAAESRTVGWLPTCDCPEHEPVPCTVLDPFGGSGTTAIAASLMGRNAISCELNPEYIDMHDTRFDEAAPLLCVREATP